MNMKHIKKMIAPVIIAAVLCIYYVGFAVVCMMIPMAVIVKLVLALIPLVLAGIGIYVCIERIKEIRSGEEDDLSKY